MVEKSSLRAEIKEIEDFLKNSDNNPIDDINRILEILIDYKNDSMSINKSNPYYVVIKEMILLESKEKFQVLFNVFNNFINKKELPILISDNLIELITKQIDITCNEKSINLLLTNNNAQLLGQIYYNINIDHIDIYSAEIKYKNIFKKLYKIGEINNVDFIEKNIINTKQQRNYDLILSPVLFKSEKVNFNNEKVDIKEAVIEEILDRLKSNGYVFGIVKDGILNNKQFEGLREKLLDKFDLLSIIEFPKTILYENRAVNTSLLIIKNSEEQNEKVFLAQLEKDSKEETNNLIEKFTSYYRGVVK
jgi:hypothetical protein